MPLLDVQSDPSGAELHDSLRQFMRAHSQGGVKRHVWSTAGTAAELTAWSGTTATLKVSPHMRTALHMQDVFTNSTTAYGWRDQLAFNRAA
jgi:hypothetical protein